MKINLNQMVDYHDAQITSRSLSKKLGLTAPIMIYAMDKEETISGEQSPQTKLIQVLAGCLEVTMGNDKAPQKLTAQDLLVIQPQQLHAFKAAQKCKFLQIEL